MNSFGGLSVMRSDKRIGDGAKVLSLLRNTDTFAEQRLSDDNALCGKVSVRPEPKRFRSLSLPFARNSCQGFPCGGADLWFLVG